MIAAVVGPLFKERTKQMFLLQHELVPKYGYVVLTVSGILKMTSSAILIFVRVAVGLPVSYYIQLTVSVLQEIPLLPNHSSSSTYLTRYFFC